MSEGAPEKPQDPVKELALQVFSALAAQSCAGKTDVPPAEAKAIGRVAFALAKGFWEADAEINAEAIAAAKSRDTFTTADLDLGAISIPAKAEAKPEAKPAEKK